MIEVPLTWQLAKLGLSISMVLGLGAIAVRASPRMAGLLAGYPLGTALALFLSAWKVPLSLRPKVRCIPWQALRPQWR
ncbi:hypothetical protein HSBAA_06070 [Vreelandella sulfidaeris]|uniref:Uncharacterized protein n=1 Tax=Vreelandella sulfidaeris TaxID=115553 RepID=A0A455U478_9GAMM|nr:hypothetical protein HSBAA_06070 [Halomonas sulfidaeris]